MSEIIKIKISKIKPLEGNPRVIKNAKFGQLVKSIIDFPEMLEKRPLIVRTKGDNYEVLGGNMRLKACKEAGIKEVSCIIVDEWSEEKQKEFIIKDNLGFGEWDYDILANQWDEVKLIEWGLDLPSLEIEETEPKKGALEASNIIAITLDEKEMEDYLKCKEKLKQKTDKSFIFALIKKIYEKSNI